MKISIIVPCYNEEEGIPSLIEQLNPAVKDLKKEYEVEIIFVDDGSKDRTYELLKEEYDDRRDVKIIRHKKNYNLGAALRTAFKHATGDVIVPMDSDCTYRPSIIKNILKLLDENTDIVIASPYHPKGKVDNVPFYRLFLSKSISKIYSIILGANIHAYTAIVGAYRKKVLDTIRFKSNDFLCGAEINISAILKGYKIKEYPATLHSRKYGKSNIRLLKVIVSHIKFIIKLIYVKLFGMKIWE